jgi:histone H3/H4
LKEVKKYQTETGFLIPHLPFSRVCREIVNDIAANNITAFPGTRKVERISPDAVHALQTEAENYIMKYLASKYYVSLGSVTTVLTRKQLPITSPYMQNAAL